MCQLVNEENCVLILCKNSELNIVFIRLSSYGYRLLTGFIVLPYSQALATTLSALYGKLLVVMGIAFPMSEVISTHIPHSFYEVSNVLN